MSSAKRSRVIAASSSHPKSTRASSSHASSSNAKPSGTSRKSSGAAHKPKSSARRASGAAHKPKSAAHKPKSAAHKSRPKAMSAPKSAAPKPKSMTSSKPKSVAKRASAARSGARPFATIKPSAMEGAPAMAGGYLRKKKAARSAKMATRSSVSAGYLPTALRDADGRRVYRKGSGDFVKRKKADGTFAMRRAVYGSQKGGDNGDKLNGENKQPASFLSSFPSRLNFFPSRRTPESPAAADSYVSDTAQAPNSAPLSAATSAPLTGNAQITASVTESTQGQVHTADQRTLFQRLFGYQTPKPST